MGKLFETFGPVTLPFYSVRFNLGEEIEGKVDDEIYVVDDFVKISLTRQIKAFKGSDASNIHDEEPDCNVKSNLAFISNFVYI